MGRRTVNGVIYEGDDANGWTVVGYDDAPALPSVVGTARQPDPADAAREAAALEGQQLLNAQRRQALSEGNGREGATNADNAADARRANLLALVDQINSVQALFESGPGATTGLGGWADYLPTDANRAFDAAGAGLVDQAMAAFRVPGVGAQSDADAARLAAAYSINASDRDAVIQQRLDQLRQRVETNMRELGMPAPQWGELASTLPRASLGNGPGTNGGPAGVAPVGEGAYRVPALAGLGREVAAMVQRGDDEAAIMAHINARHARARESMPGLQVSPDMGGFVSAIVDAHRRNPSVPVGSLSDAWGNLELARDAGGANPILNAIGQAADSPVGASIIGAANGLSAGALANESLVGGNTASLVDASRAERPGATLLGDIAGTGLGMYGLGRVAPALGAAGQLLTRGGGIGADMAYGAVRGANEAAPGEGIGGAALGAVAGAGGNLAGRGMFGLGGRLVRGVSSPAIRYLAERGVRMTPGQIMGQGGLMGRGVRALENTLESVPLIGPGITARRLEGIADYGRAQVNENMQGLGVNATGTVRDALAQGRQAVSDQYRALDGVTLTPMQDAQFVAEASRAVRDGAGLNRTGQDFETYFRQRLDPAFDAAGNLPGRNYQDVLQGVDSGMAAFERDGALGGLASDRLGDFGDALRASAARQSPDVARALDLADAGHAGMVPLENAAITAATRGGEFTPANYLRSATTNTRRFGGRARAAAGDVPGATLANFANDVLPSVVPNSGTTDRALGSLLLPSALGGASLGADQLGYGNAAGGLGVAGGLAGALALSSTPAGRAALQRALVDRPEAVRRLGEVIFRHRNRAGMFGAAAALPAVVQ